MRRIVYAGTAFYTGDALAEAVMEYARALARHGIADTVFVPGRTMQGERDRIEILLGPASQIVSEPADLDGAEILDPALVRRLTDKTAELAPLKPAAEPSDTSAGAPESFDDLG